MLCQFQDEEQILHEITVKNEMSVLLLKSKIERIMLQFYHQNPSLNNNHSKTDKNRTENNGDNSENNSSTDQSQKNDHQSEELFLSNFKYRKDLINVKFQMYYLLNNETLSSFNLKPGDIFYVTTPSTTINVYFKLPLNSTKYFIRFFKPKILVSKKSITTQPKQDLQITTFSDNNTSNQDNSVPPILNLQDTDHNSKDSAVEHNESNQNTLIQQNENELTAEPQNSIQIDTSNLPQQDENGLTTEHQNSNQIDTSNLPQQDENESITEHQNSNLIDTSNLPQQNENELSTEHQNSNQIDTSNLIQTNSNECNKEAESSNTNQIGSANNLQLTNSTIPICSNTQSNPNDQISSDNPIIFNCQFRHIHKLGWVLGPVLIPTRSFCQYSIFYTVHHLFNIKYENFKLFTKEWNEISMNRISINKPENNYIFGLYIRDETINPKNNINANPCAWSSKNVSASKLRSQKLLNKKKVQIAKESSSSSGDENDSRLALTKASSMSVVGMMKKKYGEVYCSVPVYFSFSHQRILACLDNDEIMSTQITKILQELEIKAPTKLAIYDGSEKVDLRLTPSQAKILEFSDLHISIGDKCILI